MNAILGFTELLEADVKDEMHREFLEAISTSGETLLEIINDILDLSRIEAGKMDLELEAVNPLVILNDVKNIFSKKVAEKGLNFIVEEDPDLPETLMLDALRIRQIFFNLVMQGDLHKDGNRQAGFLWIQQGHPAADITLLFKIFDPPRAG